MNAQDKLDNLLRTKSTPDEQLNLLKEVVVRQAIEYELLLSQMGTKRKSSSPLSKPTEPKRRKVEDAPVIHAPDDEELPNPPVRSRTHSTGTSLHATDNSSQDSARIAPSKRETNVPHSSTDGFATTKDHDREERSHFNATKSRRSKSNEEVEEPTDTITVYGEDVDREVLEHTPVLDPGSNKLNIGFRLVEKVAGQSGKDIVSSIGSKGGRHSHDHDKAN